MLNFIDVQYHTGEVVAVVDKSLIIGYIKVDWSGSYSYRDMLFSTISEAKTYAQFEHSAGGVKPPKEH